MKKIEIKKSNALKGEVVPPPDKSISHRAAIFSALAEGKSVIKNYLRAGDTLSTLSALKALAVEIEIGKDIVVYGRGLYGLKEPLSPIDCGNSGTTIRLLTGVLSGNPFFSVLYGDESLSERPMARVINPLKEMGSNIMARDGDRFPPIAIRGGNLKGIRYEMPVASAQVKSSLLLAGLYAEGVTEVIEPAPSRDHSERMLPAYGARLEKSGLRTSIYAGALKGCDCEVPGDFSSASFFIVAALIVPNSEVIIKNVGLNPTRTGLLLALEKMGAQIEINKGNTGGEPIGDIICRTSRNLKGIDISGDIVPSLIDEFPILCIAACCAEGITTIREAQELRVKESDRIRAMSEGLRAMGIEVEEMPDGISIKGGILRGAEVSSHKDHRIAMAFSIAGLVAEGTTTILEADAVDISFPEFYETLRRLLA